MIVDALRITPIHIFVLCPYCNKVHKHGSSNGDRRPRIEHRSSHCMENPKEYSIVIHQDTPYTINESRFNYNRDRINI